jgi:hypothetical protein
MAGHVITTNPIVDDRVIVPNDVVIDHRAVLVNVHRTIRRNNVINHSPITESARRHERVIIMAIPEAEVKADFAAPVAEAKSGTHISARR